MSKTTIRTDKGYIRTNGHQDVFITKNEEGNWVCVCGWNPKRKAVAFSMQLATKYADLMLNGRVVVN